MRPPPVQSTVDGLDHSRVSVQPEEAVGTEVGHPSSLDDHVATRPHLVHDQILEVIVTVGILEPLENPDQCVLLQGSHQFVDGELGGHGRTSSDRRDDTELPDSSVDFKRTALLPAPLSRLRRSRRSLRDLRPSYCPSLACKWGPGWSDYRKNRKQSSSSCFRGGG